ncbi:PfkB family carbohydrate kinase [Actinoplanes sp. NEAU-A12]|uniref:PfkB family carbohydrate kinase n=1 Tax=Actinoplanes sandaracinus TaxID=3045177 RepID=A0ABT6WYW1_9ACTN|nr:PfkB family carbohydrate kinase [Actinoplanes sandaracinus]MDI6104940.1 PfkB family carbohydrate kinase [Actinoplanes sandaracinus]
MRLLFAGLATVDLVQRVARFPGADEKVQSESVDVAAGGPAANAAVTAAALGAPLGIEVTLVSVVGSHSLGDLVRADLAAHGVTLIDAAPDSPEPPPVSAVTVLATTGERTIVSRNAGGRAVAVPAEGLLPGADLTLVDGHHPALAVAAARSARRLLVDAGSWRPVFAEIFPHADVVACSGDFRHPAADGDSDAATAAAVAAPHVVITHGAAPVSWHSAARPGEISAARPGEMSAARSGEVAVPRVRAVDTAGAGDAFHGALAVALVQGRELREAIGYASRTAAVRVAHAGPRAWLAHLP